MPAFTAIGWLDLWELAASLPARMGQFRGQGHRTIPLRGPSKSDPERVVWYEDAAKWPEVRALCDELDEMAAKVSGTIRALSLNMLDAGASWKMTLQHSTAIIPVRCAPGQFAYCRDAWLAPQQGAIIVLADWAMLANYGETPLIWASVSWRLGVPHAGGEAVSL